MLKINNIFVKISNNLNKVGNKLKIIFFNFELLSKKFN